MKYKYRLFCFVVALCLLGALRAQAPAPQAQKPDWDLPAGVAAAKALAPIALTPLEAMAMDHVVDLATKAQLAQQEFQQANQALMAAICPTHGVTRATECLPDPKGHTITWAPVSPPSGNPAAQPQPGKPHAVAPLGSPPPQVKPAEK